jgi:hypothetical protein
VGTSATTGAAGLPYPETPPRLRWLAGRLRRTGAESELVLSLLGVQRADGELRCVVAVPKQVTRAPRPSEWALRARVTYISRENTFELLDSGSRPIDDVLVVASLDARSDAVRLQLPFDAAPPPASYPSYGGTVELLRAS